MRICIVAEHASYRFGGEAVLPLHYFSRLRARGVEAWLVVHARTRPELEVLFANDRDRLRFIEDAWFHKLLFRVSRFLPRRVSDATIGLSSQLITQYLARGIVSKLVREESIDAVHQPIPVSPRFPSLMANLGVPVIIGPMNGGMEYPPAFRHSESLLSRASIRIGRHFSNLVNSLLPGKKLARVLLVANQRTHLALPECIQGRVIEFPENGVDLTIWQSSDENHMASLPTEKEARFVFIGRLVDWKGVDMAIEALSQTPNATLEIIGDGPMQSAWRQLAERLGVSTRVFFSGWLPQESCALRLRTATALLLPSIYECGGAVVLEALAAATPVIATRWGGPADYIDSTCGFLVEPSSREALVQGLAYAMQELIAAPELGRRMGIRGRERVRRDFDWEIKVDRMMGIYEQSIAEASRGARNKQTAFSPEPDNVAEKK
jgi:glycosyltransferase involved in cell wall biosynthesis